MDASKWPRSPSGIWFIRPAQRQLDSAQLELFFDRALALGVRGVSFANFAVTDHMIARGLASRPSTLTFVDLSNTSITDATTRALAKLPNLEHVWLSGTPITNASLAELATTSTLTSVRVDDTADAFASRANLERLDLGHTAITDATISRLTTTRMRLLDIAETQVTASLAKLSTWSDLQELYISDTQIVGSFDRLKALSNLRVLHVAGLPFDDTAAETFRSFPRLVELDLSRTTVTSASMPTLGSLVRLRSLALNELPLVDGDLDTLTNETTTLETLTLDRTSITDRGMTKLGKLKRLSQLSIKDTAVTDAGCLELAPLRLVAINIGGTHVTIACLAALSRIATLSELDADDLGLRVGDQLAATSNLVTLSLVGSKFDEKGVASLLRLRSLRELHATDSALPTKVRKRLIASGIAIE